MMPVRRLPWLVHGSRTLALLALLSFGSAAAETGLAGSAVTAFLPGFPDVPLMRELEVQEDGALVFDKPNGRIAEVSAMGPVTAADFVSYYVSALPALGWREGREDARSRTGRLYFLREGEVLQIEFARRGRLLDVRVFLSPS